MSNLPPIALKPYCKKPGCRNPGAHVEIVTGIGIGPDGDPIRRARVWCKWHGGHFLPLSEYREAYAGQRVQESLLSRANAGRAVTLYLNGVKIGNSDMSAEQCKAEYDKTLGRGPQYWTVTKKPGTL